MRTIKFRAWFPSECFQDSKARMFYNQCISGDGNVMHLEGNWDYTGDEERAIPMQFTGLLDKNAKEIYEGDILKDQDEVGVVEYRNGYFSYNGCVMGCDQLEQSQMQHEVIGNIYEHSELLST